MKNHVDNLPNDLAALKKIIAELPDQYESEIERLREENRLLRQKLFGRKSEKDAGSDDPDQGCLFDIPESSDSEDDGDDTDLEEISAHKRRKRGRKPLPETLPRVDVVHDIADEEKLCACGSECERIGEETSERLVYVPAQLYVERHIRLKYACRACEGTEDDSPTVKLAALPPRLLPKTMATPSLLAQILTGKFCDGLPFYRQERMFARIGIDFNRTTMCNWAMKIADICKPILEAIERQIRSGPLINADETTVQVLKEVGRSPTTKSYMWVFRGGDPGKPALRFVYAPTRASKVAATFLGDYSGVVQTDGYKGYDFLDRRPGVAHVGCFAHARRRFVDVLKAKARSTGKGKKQSKRTGNARKAVRFIRDIYEIEKRLRKADLVPEIFVSERKKAVEPILKELKALLEDLEKKTPPGGLLGKAVSFTRGQWPRLIRYLEYPSVTPDNNQIENAIRPFVIGRKNWLFSGHAKGAAASAALYTLIETAKANGLEPFRYLRYVFEKLPYAKSPKEIEALLPQRLTPAEIQIPDVVVSPL